MVLKLMQDPPLPPPPSPLLALPQWQTLLGLPPSFGSPHGLFLDTPASLCPSGLTRTARATHAP